MHLVQLRCGLTARLARCEVIHGYEFFGMIVHHPGGVILDDLEPAFWLGDGSFRDDGAEDPYDIPRETMRAIWKSEKHKLP